MIESDCQDMTEHDKILDSFLEPQRRVGLIPKMTHYLESKQHMVRMQRWGIVILKGSFWKCARNTQGDAIVDASRSSHHPNPSGYLAFKAKNASQNLVVGLANDCPMILAQ